MKLTIIMTLIAFLAGATAGLFMRSIPHGNTDVIYMLLGALISTLGHAINSMFKKE
jgi:CDP-diglyceride synthetase